MPISTSRLADDNLPQLAAAVDTFLQAWQESPTPPLIAEYLDACDTSLRPLLAAELVKIDLEQRWQRGLRRLIEDYVEEIPELNDQVTPALILEEFHARKLAGDTVTTNEFFVRFPELRASLEHLLAVDPMLQTNSGGDTVVSPAFGLSPGESIDDFDLLLMLGRGAFATVFLARQRSMQRIVAVKISTDKGDEPQTLAQLDHNNIVRVYDQRSIAGRGLRLLYMQYASGGTLASVIQSLQEMPRETWSGQQYLQAIDQSLDFRGESPPTESSTRQKVAGMTWAQVVCWITAQLSRALDYAHRQGVLHRDLKPANVLLTAEGVPKLADFNISFSKNLEGSSALANFGGSLAYMSPEQLEAVDPQHERTADGLDGRSDLYSLGVLTWQLLSGEMPFPHDTDGSGRYPLLGKMVETRRRGPVSVSTLSRREGLGLPDILQRCLTPEPEHRFQTGLELAHELELCLQPDAKELLHPTAGGWKSLVRRFPLVTVTLLTLIPNLIGAIFNFLYNQREIIERLPDAEPTFMRIQTIINSIVFPVGILSAGWLAGSVTKATRTCSVRKLSASELAEQRRRCLNLGNVAAAVGLTLWLIAAPAYPISLHLMLGSVPVEIYIHFMASLAICGLIAAAFPFFGVTLVAVRCFYPSLFDRASMNAGDRLGLLRLLRQTWLYLVIAAAVPMLAIVILAVAEPDRRAALVILAAGGLVGYGIAVTAFRTVQADLSVLIRTLVEKAD